MRRRSRSRAARRGAPAARRRPPFRTCEFLADDVDEERAREALAALQGRSRRSGPGSLEAPRCSSSSPSTTSRPQACGSRRRSSSPTRSSTASRVSPTTGRDRAAGSGDDDGLGRARRLARPTTSRTSRAARLPRPARAWSHRRAAGSPRTRSTRPSRPTYGGSSARARRYSSDDDELSTDDARVLSEATEPRRSRGRAPLPPPRHDEREPRRQRVPVHLRVGHRGPPRQGRRPDLRRRPRRGPRRRPLRPRRLRDARQHRPRGRLRRDLDRDLRRHPRDRPRDDPQDRLHRRRPRLLGRLLRGDQRDRQAVARHRPGRRQGARGAHRPRRRRRARRRRRGRPGDDVRLRDPRDAGADADADRARAQARPPARRGPQGRRDALPAPRRQDPGHRPLRERPADRDREGPDLDPAQGRRRHRHADPPDLWEHVLHPILPASSTTSAS